MNKYEDIINEIFIDYQTFKSQIKVIFETIDKEYITERKLSLLKQIKAAAMYTVNFQ